MTCDKLQDAVLDAVDGGTHAHNEVVRHLKTCPACAELFALHRAVDAKLAAAFAPPSLPPAFRVAVRRRIEQERQPTWWPALPETVHLLACGAATAACAVALPMPAGATLMVGVLATGFSYILLVLVEEAVTP